MAICKNCEYSFEAGAFCPMCGTKIDIATNVSVDNITTKEQVNDNIHGTFSQIDNTQEVINPNNNLCNEDGTMNQNNMEYNSQEIASQISDTNNNQGIQGQPENMYNMQGRSESAYNTQGMPNQDSGYNYSNNPYGQPNMMGGAGGYNQGYTPPPIILKKVGSIDLINRAIEILRTKPLELWGISLMFTLLVILANVFGVLPIIYLPIIFGLEAGMCLVYLAGFYKEKVCVDDLFRAFKENPVRIIGGMSWMWLWILIWALIPVVGFIFAIIKAYSYRFTPYILLKEPNITATEALRESVKRTQGYKLTFFLADLIIGGIFGLVCLLLGILTFIPFIGAMFWLTLLLVEILGGAVIPLLFGLVKAAGYDSVMNKGGQ